MAVDDEKDVVVTPDVGYGEYDPDALQELPLDMFPPNMELEEGTSIDLYDEDADEEIEAMINKVGDDTVTVDFNHPLADETLNFHIRIVGIRPATPDSTMATPIWMAILTNGKAGQKRRAGPRTGPSFLPLCLLFYFFLSTGRPLRLSSTL